MKLFRFADFNHFSTICMSSVDLHKYFRPPAHNQISPEYVLNYFQLLYKEMRFRFVFLTIHSSLMWTFPTNESVLLYPFSFSQSMFHMVAPSHAHYEMPAHRRIQLLHKNKKVRGEEKWIYINLCPRHKAEIKVRILTNSS